MGQRLSCFGSEPAAERATVVATCIQVTDPFSPTKPRSELGKRSAGRTKHRERRSGEEETSCAGSDVLEDREPTLSCASTPVVSRHWEVESSDVHRSQSQELDDCDERASILTDSDEGEITTLWGLMKDLLYGELDVADADTTAGGSSPPPRATVSPALKRSKSRDSLHSHVSSTGTFTAPPI